MTDKPKPQESHKLTDASEKLFSECVTLDDKTYRVPKEDYELLLKIASRVAVLSQFPLEDMFIHDKELQGLGYQWQTHVEKK